MAVLDVINKVIICIVSAAFFVQFVYILLFFLRPERFPRAAEKKNFAVIICAHDEEKSIGACVRAILKQKYPRDKFRVFVVADSCTDGTAAKAGEAGATVFTFTREGKKSGVAYALRFGIEAIFREYPEVDAFVRFDADDFPLPDYIDRMNDALCGGARLARGYNHATNLTQNLVSGVSGMWYIRECRFGCHARSALGVGEVLVGGGMMFAAETVRGGWTAMGLSEDAEFTADMLLQGEKAHYVSEALVYEEQPASMRALFARNMRMGRGLTRLFWTHGVRSLLRFFTTLRYSYFDLFLSLAFAPIAALCCVWFPAYYVILFSGALAPLTPERLKAELVALLAVLVFAFVLPFVAQAALAYCLDRKKIGVPIKKALPAIFAFPLFMVVYALGITAGAFFPARWKRAERSGFRDESFERKFLIETGADREEIFGSPPWDAAPKG